MTSSARTPERGEWFGILSSDYTRVNSHLSLEPGILYGLTDRWSSEVHFHVDEINESPHFESIGIEQRFFLWSGRGADGEFSASLPVDIGAFIEYEKGFGHDAHDALEFRGLFSHITNNFGASLNLIAFRSLESGSKMEYRYALGARTALSERLSAGLELTGNLQKFNESIVMPGIYLQVSRHMQILLGSSFDLSSKLSGTTVRASLLYEL